MPSFHSKKLDFCAEGRFIKAQVSVTLGHTLPSEGRAGPGVRVPAPHAQGGPPQRRSPQHLNFRELTDHLLSTWHCRCLHPSYLHFWG